MKKALSLLIVLAMLIGMVPSVFATETTQTAGFVASELGYENGTAVENIEGDVISFAFSDGGNSYGNCPKYYSTGTAIRFYSQNSLTISVAEGYRIVSVTVTTDSGKPMNADNTALTNATGEYTDASTVLTPVDGTQDVVMAYTPSSGHWRVQAVDVVYEEVSTEEPVEVTNPIVIGDNEIELVRGGENSVEYNFVATETGTLYVAITGYKVSASWSGGVYEDAYDMYDFENGTTFTVNGEALSGIYYGAVEVVAGEVYTFAWSRNEDCTYGFLATLNLSWTDEHIPAVGLDIPLTRADLPMNTVEIPAGELVTYLVSAFDFEGYVLTITGENFYVTYQQYNPGTWELETVTLEPVDGVVELDVGTKYIQEFQIGNSGTEAVSVVLDCYAPLGGIGNPIIVETLDEVEATIPAEHEGYIYFKWVATEVGTVWITPGQFYVSFENLTSEEYGDYNDSYENYSVYVEEGDELLIAITGWFEEDTFYDFPYWFEAGYRPGSEQNPIAVDLLEGMDGTLYNETIYYTWTPAQSMIVTLGFTFKYTWSSNVPTILIDGEEYTLDTELTVTAGQTYTMVLSSVNSTYGTLQATLVEVIEDDEPIEVENPIVIGDNEIELVRGGEGYVEYNFVATETGTLYVAITEYQYSASWTDGLYEDEYDMVDFEDNTVFTVNGEVLSGLYYGAVEVVAGEVYTFAWSRNEDCTYGFRATLNLSYTDENIPVPGVDMALKPEHLPMNTVEIPAGEKVLYQLDYSFDGYVLTVTGEGAYIYYELEDWWTGTVTQTRIDAVDGVVEFDFAVHATTRIYIGNDGAEAATFALDYYAPEGSMHNPILVDTLDEIELTIPAEHEGYIYFKWVATEVGTVWITPGEMYVNFENLTSGEYGDYDDAWENYSIYVEEGDELLIAITGWFEEDTFYDFPYWFVAGYREGSEQNPIEVNLMDPMELNLYNETVYYTWTPDQSMIVTLNFTYKYTWSSNLPTMLINGEAFAFGVYGTDGTETTASAQLTVTAGEPVTMVLSAVSSTYGTLQATVVEVIEDDEPIEVENPIVIGDNVIELPMGATEPSVYNFVATETGTLYIAATEFYYMASWTEGQYEDNSEYMEDWTNNTIFTVNGEELSGGFYGSIEVVKGEVYTFSWSLDEDCTWGFKASINLSYSNENMPVPGIDMMLMPSDLPTTTVEIPAGGEQLYKFSYEFNGYIITITGENAYVSFQTFNYEIWDYETVRIDAVDGVIEYDMSVYGMSEITIGNAGTEAAAFALDCYAPVGGEKNPIIVENLEDIFVSGDTELYSNVYFQWTSDKLGTIIVDTSLVNMNFYNVTKDEVGEYESDWVTYKVYVEPGDVLNIAVSLIQEADYSFTYEFYEGYRLGSELNPHPVDLLEGVYVDMYGETIYYTWTPAEDMTVTLDFTLAYEWSEKVPVIVINGEAYTLGDELTVTAGEPVLFNLSAPDGSVYGTLKATEVTGEEPVDPPVEPEIPENGEILAEETVNVPASWMGTTKTFEMTADGTLYVVIDSYPEECSVEYAFYVSGNTKNYYWTHSNGAVQSIEVLAGDIVKLELCVLGDNGNGAYVGGDVSYRLVFVPAESGEDPVEPEDGVLYDGTITTTDENAFWGEVINMVAPGDGTITVTFVYTDIYPEYQVNIADGWGEWINVLNGGADTMTYEVHEGDAIQLSVATQDATGEYVGGSVEVLVTFVAGEVGDDVEVDTELELGENTINISAGEALSFQYTFVPEVDGMLNLELLFLQYTYQGMTEDVTASLADYLAEGVIALQVNGYDYTEPVAVTAGEEVIITMTQSRMYSMYGYAWEAILNVTVTEAEEVLSGDANGDGAIDFLDAIMVLQYYTEEEANGIDLAAADMNGDGAIDFLDAIAILQFYVENEE